MEIEILQLLEGAKQAKGIAVVIDVLRAFSVEAYIMSRGAEKIFPVADVDDARKLKEENPDFILVGERNGFKLEGFDFGNSPTKVSKFDFKGKTVVHTTGAGTQGLANVKNADEILTGSLVNAKAIARYIKSKNPEFVSLVCMGVRTIREAPEDTLCARYIKSLLLGENFDITREISEVKKTCDQRFFQPELQNEFPETDFTLAMDYDKFDFVLKLKKDKTGRDYIEKIEV